jgi:hypothetical protein
MAVAADRSERTSPPLTGPLRTLLRASSAQFALVSADLVHPARESLFATPDGCCAFPSTGENYTPCAPKQQPHGDFTPPRRTTRKVVFPIFNRKHGLCGLRLSGFCTFCTPVD